MPRYSKKKKEHIGLSPYALVFRGQQKVDKVRIRAIDITPVHIAERDINHARQLRNINKADRFCWIDVDGLHDVDLMGSISDEFNIPVNILSDVMNPSLRPKVQDFETGIYVTLKMLRVDSRNELVKSENLSLVLLDDTLISFQEQPGNVFDPIRERIRKHLNKIRTAGPDYLVFALLDVVIDNYIYVIGALGDKIETLEDQMTVDPNKDLLEDINNFKRQLNYLLKNIKPAREMILNLAKLDTDLVQDQNKIHYKELQDNINEATDLAESYREILYDQLTIYHTIVSTKLNDIMRILTVISVIFMPITFIVGVYGTNFESIPEIHWKYGYLTMWLIMAIVTLMLIWYFRRKKWF